MHTSTLPNIAAKPIAAMTGCVMSASIVTKAISMMLVTNAKKAAPQVLEKLFNDVLLLSGIVDISLLE